MGRGIKGGDVTPNIPYVFYWEYSGECGNEVDIEGGRLGSFTIAKHDAWMGQKKTSDSSEVTLLNRHSSGKDFVQWKTRLTTHLDSQPVPKDYLLIVRLSDQLFNKVKTPDRNDYVKTAAINLTPAVLDEKEFIKETQRWMLTEGTIKKIVLERIEGTTLVDKFQAAKTCSEGWDALLAEINFDKDNRAEALIGQLHSFAQKSRETDLDYADRMAELVAHLRALDYPDRSNQAVADTHDQMVAKKFRLGLIEARFSFLSPILKKDGIQNDFDKMRQYIVREAQDLQLSRAQRQIDRDEHDDRALAVKKNIGKKQSTAPGGAHRAHSNDPNKLFVGGLAWKIDDQALTDLFKKFGTVTESFIVMDNASTPPRSRGFGFVTLSQATECAAAIAQMHGKTVEGRTLVVNPANAKPETKPSGPSNQAPAQGQARKTVEEDSDDDDDLPIGFA
ncbi:hypothetical protein HDU67_003722, partial [Dinochytrium kinnereticum]